MKKWKDLFHLEKEGVELLSRKFLSDFGFAVTDYLGYLRFKKLAISSSLESFFEKSLSDYSALLLH